MYQMRIGLKCKRVIFNFTNAILCLTVVEKVETLGENRE